MTRRPRHRLESITAIEEAVGLQFGLLPEDDQILREHDGAHIIV